MTAAARRVRLAAAGAVAAAILLGGCAAEEPAPSPTASRTPSSSPTASASPSPTASPTPTPTPAPAPSPTAVPSPQTPSDGTASDGWTYAQLSSICREWVLARPEQNANEEWDFDAGYPAQRFGTVWDVAFGGTFILPGDTARTEGIIGCAITGTPAEYAVGLSEATGDGAPDEVLRP